MTRRSVGLLCPVIPQPLLDCPPDALLAAASHCFGNDVMQSQKRQRPSEVIPQGSLPLRYRDSLRLQLFADGCRERAEIQDEPIWPSVPTHASFATS